MAALSQGEDYVDGYVFGFQDANQLKDHWRGASFPANIQPGMIYSNSDDDRLYHAGLASALEEILQETRSSALTPHFTSLDLKGINIVCLDNAPVCLNNEVVCLATW